MPGTVPNNLINFKFRHSKGQTGTACEKKERGRGEGLPKVCLSSLHANVLPDDPSTEKVQEVWATPYLFGRPCGEHWQLPASPGRTCWATTLDRRTDCRGDEVVEVLVTAGTFFRYSRYLRIRGSLHK